MICDSKNTNIFLFSIRHAWLIYIFSEEAIINHVIFLYLFIFSIYLLIISICQNDLKKRNKKKKKDAVVREQNTATNIYEYQYSIQICIFHYIRVYLNLVIEQRNRARTNLKARKILFADKTRLGLIMLLFFFFFRKSFMFCMLCLPCICSCLFDM